MLQGFKKTKTNSISCCAEKLRVSRPQIPGWTSTSVQPAVKDRLYLYCASPSWIRKLYVRRRQIHSHLESEKNGFRVSKVLFNPWKMLQKTKSPFCLKFIRQYTLSAAMLIWGWKRPRARDLPASLQSGRQEWCHCSTSATK